MYKSKEVESTFREIIFNNKRKNIIVGCIYRPPSFSSSKFIDSLQISFDKLELENKFVALAGDFNYNTLNYADGNVLLFSNLLSSYGFMPTISKPTRIVQRSSTLLDNIYVNNSKLIKTSGIIIDDLSDHFPVFNVLKFNHSLSCDDDDAKYCFST